MEYLKRRYTVAHSKKTKRPPDIRRRLLHANTPRGSSDDTHCADPTFRNPHLYVNRTFYILISGTNIARHSINVTRTSFYPSLKKLSPSFLLMKLLANLIPSIG